jgi:hypothetical protein
MPALLPDGTQSRLSVSGLLTGEPQELPSNGRGAIAGETVEAKQASGHQDEEER